MQKIVVRLAAGCERILVWLRCSHPWCGVEQKRSSAARRGRVPRSGCSSFPVTVLLVFCRASAGLTVARPAQPGASLLHM